MSNEDPKDTSAKPAAPAAAKKPMTRREALKLLAANAVLGAGVAGLTGCVSGGSYGGGYSGGSSGGYSYSSSSYGGGGYSSYGYSSSSYSSTYTPYFSQYYGYSSYGYFSSYK